MSEDYELHARYELASLVRANKRKWLFNQPCPDCVRGNETRRSLEANNDYLRMAIKCIVKRMAEAGVVEAYLGDDWPMREKRERALSAYCDAYNASFSDLPDLFRMLDEARSRPQLSRSEGEGCSTPS